MLVLGAAVITAVIKAAGPVALGGRELPARFNGFVALLAPALFAALIVTQVLADGEGARRRRGHRGARGGGRSRCGAAPRWSRAC